MNVKLNEAAFQHAKQLIEQGKIVFESQWAKAKPTTDAEDRFIEEKGWDDYAKWYLGMKPEIDQEEKQKYEFPYGDFKKVHREGIIAAQKRAAQYKHPDIEQAADELLLLIEKKEAIKMK